MVPLTEPGRSSKIQGSPLVTTAFIPAKNCPYKRDVVTSMHFTITNPHLILFGPSKFCRYIQICSYKHGRYKRASLYYLPWVLLKKVPHEKVPGDLKTCCQNGSKLVVGASDHNLTLLICRLDVFFLLRCRRCREPCVHRDSDKRLRNKSKS